MRADKRKYHILYKTTRTDGSGRYYIGIHSADEIDDKYLGSGKELARSIKKHGRAVHRRETLELLPSRELLKKREEEVVNEVLLADPLCMNQRPGGVGGFISEEHLRACTAKSSERGKKLRDEGRGRYDPEKQKIWTSMGGQAYKKKFPDGWWAGKSHSEEAKQRMSNAQTAEKNAQFGSKWMNKDGKTIKVPATSVAEYIANGYIAGRLSRTKS